VSAIRIFLVRHGETEWNRIPRFQGRSDVPLNQMGREQARALAMALQDEPIQAVYSSPLARALETANIIKDYHPSIPLFEEPGFIEMDLGAFEGMEPQDWIEKYPHLRKVWQETPSSIKMPGGESLQEVQKRAMEALEQITQNYPPRSTVLVASHNFVIRTILCRALGESLDRFREFKQGTAALNILYKEGNTLWADVLDDRTHLQGPNGIQGSP